MPINRPELHKLFCRIVTQLKGIGENNIYDMLDLIHAPTTLQAFFIHIPLLPEIFQAIIEIAEISGLIDDRYREAEKTATAINSILPDLLDNPELRDLRIPKPTPRYGPCEGLLYSHPLYSALSESFPQKRYIYLQAQILLAVSSLDQIDEKLLFDLYDPFRSFRSLTKPENLKYIDRLPDKAMPIASYAENINSWLDNPKFKPIGHIFHITEKPLSKNKRKKTPFEKKTFVPKFEREDDEDTTVDYFRNIQPPTTLTQPESKEYIIHGGLPEELGADVDLQPVPVGNKYHGPSRRQLAFQAKQASNRRAMNNQFCAMAWNQANLFDLNALFEFLEGSNQLEGFDFKPLTLDDAVILLGLILFTCNPLERVLSYSVFPGIVPGFESPEGIYHQENGLPVVRLYTSGPELAGRIKKPGAFPVDIYINIPLPQFFVKCLEKIGTGITRPYLFSNIDPKDDSCIQEIQSVLRRILGELNKVSGARLSLGRISSYLLFRLAEAEKCDLPCAMLFYGRNDKIARTRIHYTLAESDHLETSYRKCTNRLLGDLGRSGHFSLNETVNSGGYLGTPFCPTPGTVKKICWSLQSAVKSSVFLSMADRHNLYTLYTSMLISYGTGFRAIHDPSLKEMEIDFDWGIGIISDKGESSYRSRYVFLSPVVLDQIKYYRRHLQIIYGKLGVTNPSLFDMIKSTNYEGLPLNLFWLNGDLEPVELLTPGVAKIILKRDHQYTIPLNSGRHYLKYRLLKEGCSPELIESHLGHWENGQEPWGRFSNLDPLDFAMQMAGYLPEILKKDGWLAIRGLG